MADGEDWIKTRRIRASSYRCEIRRTQRCGRLSGSFTLKPVLHLIWDQIICTWQRAACLDSGKSLGMVVWQYVCLLQDSVPNSDQNVALYWHVMSLFDYIVVVLSKLASDKAFLSLPVAINILSGSSCDFLLSSFYSEISVGKHMSS